MEGLWKGCGRAVEELRRVCGGLWRAVEGCGGAVEGLWRGCGGAVEGLGGCEK